MKVSDVQDSALRRFGEGTGVSHFSSAMLVNWVNETQREFLIQTKLYYGTVGTTVTAGDRLCALATSMFLPVRCRFRGRLLGRASQEELDVYSHSKTWKNSQGSVMAWYPGENFNKIAIYRRVAAGSGGTVVAEGYRTAADLTAGNTPIWEPQFHPVLIEGLIMRMASEDADNARNQIAYERAEKRYNQYVELALQKHGRMLTMERDK